MSAAQAARLIWIHGGRSIDPRTADYFAGKIVPAPADRNTT